MLLKLQQANMLKDWSTFSFDHQVLTHQVSSAIWQISQIISKGKVFLPWVCPLLFVLPFNFHIKSVSNSLSKFGLLAWVGCGGCSFTPIQSPCYRMCVMSHPGHAQFSLVKSWRVDRLRRSSSVDFVSLDLRSRNLAFKMVHLMLFWIVRMFCSKTQRDPWGFGNVDEWN